MICPQLKFDIKNEIIIDNFAGGGCASTDLKIPPRQHMSVANNHGPKPPATHSLDAQANRHADRALRDVSLNATLQ